MMQHLPRMNRVKRVVGKWQLFAKLLHNFDGKPSLSREKMNCARSNLLAFIGLQGGDYPSVTSKRITGNAVTGPEVEDLPSLASSEQAGDLGKFLTIGEALSSLANRQIEIVVANLSFIAGLCAVPAYGFFPGQLVHGTPRSSSVKTLIILAGFPATIVHGGTCLVTTLPAPTMAPSPIITPFRIIARVPIHALSAIITGAI